MKKTIKKVFSILLIISIFSLLTVLAEEDYTGIPFKKINIPGVVRFSDFDVGENGVTHYRNGSATVTSSYRKNANLQIYDANNGEAHIGFNAGTWTKYTVEVLKDGEYEMILDYASPVGPLGFEVSVDDVTVVQVDLETTKNYMEAESAEIGKVSLKAGKHVLTFSQTKGGINAHKLTFQAIKSTENTFDFSKKSGSYRTTMFPGIIEAEDFDLGKDGRNSNDGKNNGKVYRKNDGIDIFQSKNGGYYIKLSKDEYTRYTFDVPESGVYKLLASSDSTTTVYAYFDGKPMYAEKKFRAGNGFSESEIVNIYLPKGQHTLKLMADLGNVDYISFESTSDDYIELSYFDTLNFDISKQVTQKDNKIYKELYLSQTGSDSGSGEKNSPFATLKRAKEEIAKINSQMNGDIIVNVSSGYYQLTETEKFGVENGGKNGFNVIFRGEDTQNPPIISGGLKVAGWEKTGSNIYKAPLDAGNSVRNLYVNGYPSIRARSKYKYLYEADFKSDPTSSQIDGLTVSTIDFPKFKNPQALELIWDMDWNASRTVVDNIVSDGEKTHLYMSQKAWKSRKSSTSVISIEPGKYFFIENALELLDEPGEFFYDKNEKCIYYYPYENEDMSTADTYVGKLEFMMNISGTGKSNKIENLVFDNLDFRYGEWFGVDNQGGTIAYQADQMVLISSSVGKTIREQIRVDWAKNVDFTNCKFSCLGSTAIRMVEGVSNSSVTGNLFKDIGGSGISIGSTEHIKFDTDNTEICSDISVENNVFRRCANEYRGCTAVAVFYEYGITIAHNDILDMPYTGITVGWGWGTDSAYTGDIRVSYNYIENVMTSLYDGGPVYTLGNIPGGTVDNNYFKKANASYAGLYTDSGSGSLRLFNNVLENCRSLWLVGVYNTHDNWAYNNFCDEYFDRTMRNSTNKVTDTKIVENGNWPEEARRIMKKAGTEAGYKKLRELSEFPKWRYDIVDRIPKKQFVSQSTLDKIEAEDFLPGGQNVGYYKLKEKPKNNQYRIDGVPLLRHPKSNQGYVIHEDFGGEWFKYEFEVSSNGNYNIVINAAQAWALSDKQPAVNIYIDDELVIQDVPILSGGDWFDFIDSYIGKAPLQAGKHYIKIELLNNGFYFDYFKILTDEQMASEKTDSPDFNEGKLISEQELREKLTVVQTVEVQIEFADTVNHWANEDIKLMAKYGLVNGMSETEFAPDNPVTLYQSALLAMRALKIYYKEDDWKKTAISRGIIDGNWQDRAVTREEFIDVVMRAYMSVNKKYKLTIESKPFEDVETVSQNYVLEVLGAKELKIIKGDTENRFNPKNDLTRAEATVIIKRLAGF